MEDFLSDVTDEMIEGNFKFDIARLLKMKQFLQQEHLDILKKIEEQSEYIYSISN